MTVGETIPGAPDSETGDANPELLLTKSMDKYITAYEKKSNCRNPRDLHPDKPARTLTCRNLAGCTSDMIRVRLQDGRRRQLTTEEASLLQTFPSNYFASVSRTSAMKMIGNAVPPLLAKAIARSAFDYLESLPQSQPVERGVKRTIKGTHRKSGPAKKQRMLESRFHSE